MPVVAVERLTRPEHVVEYLAGFLADSTLPLAYIAKYDERLLNEYPAALVVSGGHEKEIHGTHTWLITLRADIYIMHAKLTEDRATRNKTDLELATSVVALLEEDLSLGQRIIAGFVEREIPGAMPPRTAKGSAVVSTRLSWAGTVEGRF